MPREPETLRAWMKAADIDLSRAIRIEASDAHGVVQCVTCPYTGFWSDGKMSGVQIIILLLKTKFVTIQEFL